MEGYELKEAGLVMLGGASGALTRYMLQQLALRIGLTGQIGLLTVNVSGRPNRVAAPSRRGIHQQLYDVRHVDVGQLPVGTERLGVDGLAESFRELGGGFGRCGLGIPGRTADRAGRLEGVRRAACLGR